MSNRRDKEREQARPSLSFVKNCNQVREDQSYFSYKRATLSGDRGRAHGRRLLPISCGRRNRAFILPVAAGEEARLPVC